MNKEIISTSDLTIEINNINNLIDNLDNILDNIKNKMEQLSTENEIYYSNTSIKIYDNYMNNHSQIKKLHTSLKDFINQTPKIIDEYEDLETKIIEQIDKIESINTDNYVK